jgi:hypothetical protein
MTCRIGVLANQPSPGRVAAPGEGSGAGSGGERTCLHHHLRRRAVDIFLEPCSGRLVRLEMQTRPRGHRGVDIPAHDMMGDVSDLGGGQAVGNAQRKTWIRNARALVGSGGVFRSIARLGSVEVEMLDDPRWFDRTLSCSLLSPKSDGSWFVAVFFAAAAPPCLPHAMLVLPPAFPGCRRQRSWKTRERQEPAKRGLRGLGLLLVCASAPCVIRRQC